MKYYVGYSTYYISSYNMILLLNLFSGIWIGSELIGDGNGHGDVKLYYSLWVKTLAYRLIYLIEISFSLFPCIKYRIDTVKLKIQ